MTAGDPDRAPPPRVVVVDDDAALRKSLTLLFETAGAEVDAHARAEPALAALDGGFDGVVVADLRMPGLSGLDLAEALNAIDPAIPVLLLTAHGDVPSAVAAMRAGALDFLEKPFDPDALLDRALDAASARRALVARRAARLGATTPDGLAASILGESRAMRDLRDTVLDFADADASVLILGETGVGKELIARALHAESARKSGAFVGVNCAAVPETMFEAALFGHVAGAFTGAAKSKPGFFQAADGGVLFLDELASLPLAMQPKLLRALEEREAAPVGATEPDRVDLRVLAAADLSLETLRAEGRFRDDLYYRLNTLVIRVPPLRARGEDAVLLFETFLARAATRYETAAPTLDAADVAAILAHPWPGNVRELAHVAERHALASRRRSPSVGASILGASGADAGPAAANETLRDQVDRVEAALIRQALAKSKGDIAATCDALGLPRRTLNEKMARHGLARDDFT